MNRESLLVIERTLSDLRVKSSRRRNLKSAYLASFFGILLFILFTDYNFFVTILSARDVNIPWAGVLLGYVPAIALLFTLSGAIIAWRAERRASEKHKLEMEKLLLEIARMRISEGASQQKP